MSDTAAVALALAAAAGALAARPVPVAAAAVLVAVALVRRRPWLLAAGAGLAASGLAALSWSGLEPPAPGPVDRTVTLVGDPRNISGALRVDARMDGRRVEAWARGRAAGRLRDRLAGERVQLTGRLAAVPASERARLAPRHIAARLTVDSVGGWSPGSLPTRLANGVRRTLVSGAGSLPRTERGLFAGFVLGDDRDQPPEVTFDFRASGLAHLLVVSGQNVAFVLAVAGPLLRRLGLGGRLLAAVAILGLFGILTRWEPSVLRAVAMATIALVARTLGRQASSLRLLALAVAGLLLIDPLLVHSIGFRLSAGACLGIALFGGRLASVLPGPRPVADALAVTLAAQAGVAPVMIPVFGGLPVATLAANLLALPAGGPLMVWGLVAGLPAGVVGEPLAALAHVPTRLLVGWVALVARATAALPLGHLGALATAALFALAAGAWVAARAGRRGLVAVAGAGAVAVLLLPGAALVRPSPLDAHPLGRGAAVWRAGAATVVVLDGAQGAPDRIMSALHRAGVRHLDLLVASRPGIREARAAETIQRRFPAAYVLGPPRTRVPGAAVPPHGATLHLGPLTVGIAHAGDRLAVTVSRPGARGPPVASATVRLTLGEQTFDLTTRALVVAALGAAPGAAVADLCRQAASAVHAGADVVEVGGEWATTEAVGAVAQAVGVPVAVAPADADAACQAVRAGARLLLAGGPSPAAAASAGEAAVVVRAPGGGTVAEARAALVERVRQAEAAGVPPRGVILEPGAEHLVHFRSLAALGYPLLLTCDATTSLARMSLAVIEGCRVLRTGEPRAARRVSDVLAAVMEARW